MSTQWSHNEYFRRRLEDNSLYTFTNTEDAKTKIALHSTFLNTSNPSITYELQDSNQTLKVTLSFASVTDQNTWKTSVDELSFNWRAPGIEWFKIEWLDQNGNVGVSANL
jgi:hypothetical protein